MADRRVQSNSSADNLKLYGTVGLAGLAAGAGIAVRNDPLYDDEKRLRGKEIKRKVPWKQDYTSMNLDPLDADMYDLHVQQGNKRAASKLEGEARRKFHGESWEHQRNMVDAWNKPTPEIKGSFRAKMLNGARKITSKL